MIIVLLELTAGCDIDLIVSFCFFPCARNLTQGLTHAMQHSTSELHPQTLI